MEVTFQLVELLGLVTLIAAMTVKVRARLAMELSTSSVLVTKTRTT
jgi:hypothetical protein